MRAPASVLVGLAGLLAVACGSPCQDLADRICDCQPVGGLRDSCKASVKNQISSGAQRPSDADQVYCQQQLAVCPDPAKDVNACDAINSPDGKRACGFAYPAPTPTPSPTPAPAS